MWEAPHRIERGIQIPWFLYEVSDTYFRSDEVLAYLVGDGSSYSGAFCADITDIRSYITVGRPNIVITEVIFFLDLKPYHTTATQTPGTTAGQTVCWCMWNVFMIFVVY
jgi:hypothetical protein